MRSRASAADMALISRLADDGLAVSPSQLERWRGMGLMPRATVVRDAFGGSRVLEHSEEVVATCAFLAQASGRGRPWQYTAIDLFEVGGTLSTDAVRAAAIFLHHLQLKGFRRAWELAEAGVEPMDGDPVEWVADVATKAATLAPRAVHRVVRQEIELVHPNVTGPRLREATERAVVWRIADINAPMFLTDEQRTWARHGFDEPLDPLADNLIALPSERADCVATLTWAEANLARLTLVGEQSPLLEQRLLIDLATWRVVTWRMQERFDHPEQPLSDAVLARILKWSEEAHDQFTNSPAETPATKDSHGEGE